MSRAELINMPDSAQIIPANVPVGTWHWRVIKIECWDYKRSNGSNYLYAYKEQSGAAVKEELANMVVYHDDTAQNLAISASSYYMGLENGKTYSAEIKGAASDRVEGMKVSSDGVASYSIWWEWALADDFGVRSLGDDGLADTLLKAGEEYRLLELNPQAALLREIINNGFVPISEEILVEHEGVYYNAQSCENVEKGTMRVYYAKTDAWENVKWVEK